MGTWRSNKTNRRGLNRGYQVCKLMEGTVKLRLLLTSALFVFAQIAAPQAQDTVDVAKITCQPILKEKLASPTHDIVLWLSGYYNGNLNSTIINHRTINYEEKKVRIYCYQTPGTPVLEAIKNVLGLEK